LERTVGGVFSYQLLVAAEAASQPLAVAVAALGAGMVLNNLLDFAVNTAAKLIPSGRSDNRGNTGNTGSTSGAGKLSSVPSPTP
jgi:hypothetical protein